MKIMERIGISLLLFLMALGLKAESKLWNELLVDHVDSKGWVNYKGFQKDEEKLDRYLEYLNATDIKGWTENRRKAFWMNAYNAYTVKLILNHYPLKSIMDIKVKDKNAWEIPFAKVGGKVYTLNAIEHDILRPKFKDPRIHVGINCASYSCPPLANKAFTEKNVELQLEKLMKTFINDPLRNTMAKESIEISELFNWFKSDFTEKTSLIDYLNKYSKTKISKTAKINYKKYNWSLNQA